MALTLVPLAGTEKNADGTGANGSIDFQLSAPLVDAVSGITVNTEVISIPVVNGVYAVNLYANDSVGVAPPGTFYTITKRLIVGQTATEAMSYATVPSSLSGGGAGLDDLSYLAGPGGSLDLAAHISDLTMHGTGRELGYAETTTDVSVAGAATLDVPGLTTTIQCSGKPISVEWGGFIYASVNTFSVYLQLVLDSVEVGRAGATLPAANGVDYVLGLKRLQPAAGSHVIKGRLYVQNAGGTGHVLGASYSPATLLAIEHP